MSSTYPITNGFHGTPIRRVEPMFLQPRRFPEYLKLQNRAERREDIAELSSGGLGAKIDAARGGSRDETIARIGDVLPVEQGLEGLAPARSAGSAEAAGAAIAGMGRLIDVLA